MRADRAATVGLLSLDLLAGEDQPGQDQLSGWQTIGYAILVGAAGSLLWLPYSLARRKPGTGAQGR